MSEYKAVIYVLSDGTNTEIYVARYVGGKA